MKPDCRKQIAPFSSGSWLAILAGSLFTLTNLQAQTSTWTGAVNNLWATPANWNVAPPFNGTDQLLFNALVQPSQILGATRAINRVTFNQGGFTLSGNALTLNGTSAGIICDGNNIIASDVYSLAPTIFRSKSGTLTFNGLVTTNGGPIPPAPTLEGIGNFTINGSIQGTGGLVMNGKGTLLLNGTNYHVGSTVINGGVLKTGSGTTLTNAGALIINAGGTFDLNGVNPTVSYLNGTGSILLGANILTMTAGAYGQPNFAGSISGNGGIIIQLATEALQTLSGTSTYLGGTTVKSGFLTFSGDASLGNASGKLTLDGGGLKFANSTTLTRPITLGPGGAKVSTQPGTVSYLPSSITGSGPLTYGGSSSGEGTWVAAGNYTYSGSTTVYTGSLAINSPNQLGALGNPLKASEGSLLLRGGITVAGRSINIAGYGNSATGSLGALVSDTGINTWTGPLANTLYGRIGCATGSSFTISGPISGGETLYVRCQGNTVISGTVTDTDLAKEGPGSMTLSGTNAAGGGVSAYQGAINLQGGNAVADNAIITLYSGTTLRLEANETVAGVSDSGLPGAMIDLSNHDLTIKSGASFAGTISGTGRVYMLGTGSLTLTGTNTFSGGLYILAGILNVASDASLGAPTNPVFINGGQLIIQGETFPATSHSITFGTPNVVLNVSNGTFTLGQPLANSGSFTKMGAGTLLLTGTNTYAGGTVLKEGILSVSADALLGQSGSGITFQGGTLRVTGTTFRSTPRPLTFTSFYSGLDVADAANIFTINQVSQPGGTLRKLGAGALVLATPAGLLEMSTLAGTTRLALDDAVDPKGYIFAATGAVFDLNGFNQTIRILSAYGLVSTSQGTLSITDYVYAGGINGLITGQLALTGTSIGFDCYSDYYSAPGWLKVAASISGSSAINKLGSGTVEFAGNNSFSGTIAVTAGTLAITGSSTSVASANITKGAMLEIKNGNFGVSGDLINNGWLRLVDTGTIFAGGVIQNNGVIDLTRWTGVLPANVVNGPNGVILYPADVRVSQFTTSAAGVQLTLSARAGLTYQLQRATSLTAANWISVAGQPIAATVNGPITLTDSLPASTAPQTFYRVVLSVTFVSNH